MKVRTHRIPPFADRIVASRLEAIRPVISYYYSLAERLMNAQLETRDAVHPLRPCAVLQGRTAFPA